MERRGESTGGDKVAFRSVPNEINFFFGIPNFLGLDWVLVGPCWIANLGFGSATFALRKEIDK